MHEPIVMQLTHAPQQLQVEVPYQITREALTHFNQLVQLPVLRKIHHVVAYWVLPLQYTTFF